MPADRTSSTGGTAGSDGREALSFSVTIDSDAVIARARAAVDGYIAPTRKTALDYDKKLNQYLKEAGKDSASKIHLIRQFLAERAPCANTFYAYRAAFRWVWRFLIIRTLAQLDALSQARKADESLAKLRLLSELVDGLEKIELTDRQAALELAGLPSKRLNSKRNHLAIIERRASDWRERILEAVKGRPYEEAVQLLSLVGCRPSEILKGVVLHLDRARDVVVVRIQGAKVTGKSGQEWRVVQVRRDRVPPDWVTKMDRAEGMTIKITNDSHLRTCLREASKTCLPKLPIVSPYVFRHALAGDLREEGAQAEEISAILGHCVADTQAGYGMRRRAGGRVKPVRQTGILKEGTTTPRQIRPLDRSGLEQVKAMTKKRKAPKKKM